MESAEKATEDLRRNIGGSDIPPSEIKPSLTKDLKQIGVNAAHFAGSTFEEVMEGEGPDTRTRVTSGKNPGRWLLERTSKMRNIFKKVA